MQRASTVLGTIDTDQTTKAKMIEKYVLNSITNCVNHMLEQPTTFISKIVRDVQTGEIEQTDTTSYRRYDDEILYDVNAQITEEESRVKEKLKQLQERAQKGYEERNQNGQNPNGQKNNNELQGSSKTTQWGVFLGLMSLCLLVVIVYVCCSSGSSDEVTMTPALKKVIEEKVSEEEKLKKQRKVVEDLEMEVENLKKELQGNTK